MGIAVAIVNHDQHSIVKEAIKILASGTIKPEAIYVLSDGKPFKPMKRHPEVIPINNPKECSGRCANRNSVIGPFLKSGINSIVFLDGDCVPEDSRFLETYEGLLDNHDLVFGTRRHTDVSGLALPPSDLLTANMDNLYRGKPLDYTDLRVVSGAVKAWKESKTFHEKVDLMLTGMIGWSCNFGFSRKGLYDLRLFQRDTYGFSEGIFDSNAFSGGWGYEDVAMGIDAMYAGLDVDISDRVRVVHRSHERSDELFDHVKGRHAVMDRYRELEKSVNAWENIKRAAILASAFFTGGLITGMVTYAVAMEHVLGIN